MEQSKSRWWVLTAMCLLTVMLNIDVTALNIAIPVIAKDFNATLTSMQWVINAYVLLSAMFQIFGGRLGDSYGHKKVFLIGTALFIIASAIAGASINENMLIAARTVQGFALGIAYPMTIILTLAAFPKNKQGFALSFIVASMGVSLAIGPPLGGLFVAYLGWRWIFYINVPLGLIALFIAYRYCLPHRDTNKMKIDYKGAMTLIAGLFFLMFALNQVQNWGFSSYKFALFFILGAIFLIALYFIEKKPKFPIIDFSLFKYRNFFLNNLIRLVVQLVLIPVLFFMPLYLQNIAGFTPIYSGMLMIFLTLVIGVISPIAGRWIDKVGDKIPTLISMVLFALGCFIFILLDKKPDIALLGIGLLIIGIAVGITFVSTITGSVSVTPEKDHGIATGIIFTIGWLGCALGVALMGAILSMSSLDFLHKNLTAAALTLSSSELNLAERVAKGIAPTTLLSQGFSGDLLQKINAFSTNAFMHGFRVSMFVWMLLSVVGLILSLFLKKHLPEHHEEIPQR